VTRPAGYALRFVATPKTGLGHARRMLSLAAHLPRALCVIDPETAATLRALGTLEASIRVIDPAAAPGAWSDDPDVPRRAVFDLQYSGNAEATATEVAVLKRAGFAVSVIDSMPPDQFVACPGGAPDLVVTPYLGADRLRPRPEAGSWLHGPSYAILPAELVEARADALSRREPRILIACGGVDKGGLSARILARLEDAPVAKDVVIGPMFAPALKAELADMARGRTGVARHDAPTSLVPLYRAASLVVGRPGLTRYEAACLGRHGIYLADGADYGEYFAGFAEAGSAEIYVEAPSSGGADDFFRRLDTLRDPDTFERLARPNRTAMDIVDGRGAERVARAIDTLAAGEFE
jgi:UDP-2,4-diacetamido-2,4,6-trideoxy-beta-L-altropyranose hydrolase